VVEAGVWLGDGSVPVGEGIEAVGEEAADLGVPTGELAGGLGDPHAASTRQTLAIEAPHLTPISLLFNVKGHRPVMRVGAL
jgi:hypothetical protein